MKDEPTLADKPEKGILVREGDNYRAIRKSLFEETETSPDYKGNVILVEKLDNKIYSFSLKASPSLSTDPEVYLKALRNIFDNKHIELSNPRETMDLGVSFDIPPVLTGGVEFSGKYNTHYVRGTIGADVNIIRDLVRVDIEYIDKNKKILSSIRKALLGINPEIDGSSDIICILDVSRGKGKPQELYVNRKATIV